MQRDSKTSPSSLPSDSEDNLFKEAFGDVKPMVQDKIIHPRRVKKKVQNKAIAGKHVNEKQVAASFEFSDIYQAKLPDDGPMRYCRSGHPSYVVKQLRRGDYSPELILDLHGLTRAGTKNEVAALIHAAREARFDCVAIVHGIGEGVLKKALPHYLVQHPHVIAFHQAPLEYGGQGALLVLIEIEEPNYTL